MEELNIKIEFILNQIIIIQAQNKKLNVKVDKCLEIISKEKNHKSMKLLLPPLQKLQKLPSNSEEFCDDAAAT